MKTARTRTNKRTPRPRSRTAAPRERPAAPVAASGPGFIVRPAKSADVAAVTALDEKITGLAKPAHWLEMYERRTSAGAAPAGIFLVATTADGSDRLLGFIIGEIRAWEFGSAPCGWVYALSVEPGSRLRGIGESLLKSIAAEFRKAGLSKMRTMVARDNLLPMLFFRGEGMMAGPYLQLEKDL